MSTRKVVIHTDVLLAHVCGTAEPSALRLAMGQYFCYATVFHAIELFALARTDRERKAVEDTLSAMKILGLNARGARRYSKLLARRKGSDRWTVLIAGLCMESGLPLMTGRKAEFREFRGLKVIAPPAGENAPNAMRIQEGE